MQPDNNNTQRPAEFDEAVMQWLPLLHKMARRLERHAQDREDLVNETVATALRRWAGYRDGGNMAGWLVFQMRSIQNDARRKKRIATVSYSTARDVKFDDDGNRDAPKTLIDRRGEAPRQDNIVELSQVLGAMDGRGGEVLRRRAAGERLEEIGTDMGITRERVRQLEVAARAGLKKRLNAAKVAA